MGPQGLPLYVPRGPATTPLPGLWAADFTLTSLGISFTLVLLLCGAAALRLYLRRPQKLPAVLVSLGQAAAQPAAPQTWGARCPVLVLPSARCHEEAPAGTLGRREDWHPEQPHPARSVVPVELTIGHGRACA